MAKALTNTEFHFKKQKSVYHGKVRDVYDINDEKLVMVATDRISAFDHILKNRITGSTTATVSSALKSCGSNCVFKICTEFTETFPLTAFNFSANSLPYSEKVVRKTSAVFTPSA